MKSPDDVHLNQDVYRGRNNSRLNPVSFQVWNLIGYVMTSSGHVLTMRDYYQLIGSTLLRCHFCMFPDTPVLLVPASIIYQIVLESALGVNRVPPLG